MAPAPSVAITALTPTDIPGAIHCIQAAFADDPYNRWVFDHSKFSLSRNQASLRSRCLWGMQSDSAIFVVAKDTAAPTPVERERVLGVACWLRPRAEGQPQSWADWLADWVLWGRQGVVNLWWGRGGLVIERYRIWKAAQSQAQAALWTDPAGYYFCNIVTVLPTVQGRGVGRALFEHVTARADAEGRSCYLESSRDAPNTDIYARMGFRKVREMVCDDEGEACKLYCMVRDPKTGS